MIYDVTNPLAVSFVQYMRRPGDVSPEGLAFVAASDSPNGKALLVVANETSNTLSVYQNQTYTLQLLHLADGEAGLLASTTAPRLAAMIDRFEDSYANSITLAGGDNFIPGPFLAAGTDSSVIPALNAVSGSTLAATATVPIAAADIVIHNLLGVEASTIGNHEFDLGSRVFRDSFISGSGYVGAQFPYLSSNLDFSGDADLSGRFTNTTATAGLELASANKGRIVPSAVLDEGGQKIGLVGATTQLLEAISSPSGTEVRGFPTGPGANGEVDNMDLLATQLQPVIDDLISQGVNKIILMSHLQVLANERLLATKLSGVDIILAAGSNTRLGDANDTAVAFPGHAANFADTYPVVIRDKTGGNTLLVNTDNEYTYLGRLVVDFDNAGQIRLDSLAANTGINGAYAATDANVAAAWGVDAAQLSTTAYAAGTRAGNVKTLTDAVQGVIDSKDGVIYGQSTVYLEGERAKIRSEETNLGNLTADANRYATTQALGAEAAGSFIVSLKNGGGIRAQIGTISSPKPDGTVDFLPPDGGVSQLDVENSLRFNNQLMVFDTTPEGLKAILEHGVAAGTLQGRFPQIGGVAFSWDPDFTAGARVNDIALVGDNYRVNLYNDGTRLASAPAKITVVTLSFLANGGDSYPIKANGENFRYLVEGAGGTRTLSASVDEALNFTDSAITQQYVTAPGAAVLAEQSALRSYMQAFHATPANAFAQADTPAAQDTRIQNLNARSEDVLSTLLDVGDLRFVAANADATDAFSFILLKSVVSGTQVGFTDRNFVEASGMPASGEAAYLWTADRAYAAGTIVTIQPDVATGTNPLADRGTVRGAGGGLSASGETIYAFQGGIAGLLDGGAGAISIDRLLASLNVGGAAAGDIPTSIATTSQSFNADNAKYTASTSATDVAALSASVGNSANWTLNDTTAFALSNGSLF
jgi:2',3'-cyclic-nucleotide 2'-phosphodiesterase (5'-nucleotidase family)